MSFAKMAVDDDGERTESADLTRIQSMQQKIE